MKVITLKFCIFFMHRNYINDSSNIIFKGIVTDSQRIFTILIDTLSYPCYLLESNDLIFIIDYISLFVTRKETCSGIGLI